MLCKCGCGQETPRARRTANGRRKGDSYDFIAWHHMRVRPTISWQERFQRRVQHDPSGCWLWTGATTSNYGYGHLSLRRGQTEYAHRLAYRLAYGEIPAGWVIDHLCRTPACVNPAHLEAVPHRTNILRGIGPTVALHHAGVCKRGHPRTPETTYYRKDRGRNVGYCRLCQREARKARALEVLR